MYYLIRDSLIPCVKEDIKSSDSPFVAVLSSAEWKEQAAFFDMGIDMEMDTARPLETKAVVNLDSLTGSFSIPDRGDVCGKRPSIAFAL